MNVSDHYDKLLADHYTWLFGGLQDNIAKYTDFFNHHSIAPSGCGQALDLGAGSGFQSIPLARLGFWVTAIDSSRKLLEELRENCAGLDIVIKAGDLTRFNELFQDQMELAVCMGDTLTHLNSTEEVICLFRDIHQALEADGRFILSFRDMSHELSGVDRFIPVRMEQDRLVTCFLEYERDCVMVHDLLHLNQENGWEFKKSAYRKLRLSQAWVEENLNLSGFRMVFVEQFNGMVTLMVQK